MRRLIVIALERVDYALREVLDRPAVVKAFAWLPRWYASDLALLSVRLDDEWQLDWWGEYGPSGVCEACGRRGAWISLGGWDENFQGPRTPEDNDFADDREVHLCGWCAVQMPYVFPANKGELQAALRRAGQASVSWRWQR